MAVLLVLGGATKCWLHGGYGVSASSQSKNSSHALGVIDYWVGEINKRVSSSGLVGEEGVEHVLWLSDSNFVSNEHNDRLQLKGGRWREGVDKGDSTAHLYHTFVSETGLHDVWTVKHGEGGGFTRVGWQDVKGRPSQKSRIDHIMASDELAEMCVGMGVLEVGGAVESDHHMIVEEFDVGGLQGGAGRGIEGGNIRSIGVPRREDSTADTWVKYKEGLGGW